MKKIVLLTLACALLLAIAACTQQEPETPEIELPVEATPDPNELLDQTDDVGNGIKVLGEVLEGYRATVDGDEGNIMVPLIPVAEKLGINVEWNEEEQTAIVDHQYILRVGSDSIMVDGEEPMPFGPAPAVYDGLLYVPRTFFEYALGGYVTFVADGFVVIERAA